MHHIPVAESSIEHDTNILYLSHAFDSQDKSICLLHKFKYICAIEVNREFKMHVKH